MKTLSLKIQIVFLLVVSPLPAQTFSDSTHLVHPPINNVGLGISAADFNGDGLPDIYYPWAFYINRGAAGFEEVKFLTGVQEGINVFGAAFGDYDNDGFLDALFEDLQAPSRLYRNKRTLMLGYANPAAGLTVNPAAQGAGWSDYNLDGTLDLFVNNDFGDNQLFRNDDYRFLTDVSAAAGVAASGNSYGMAWGDYNLDGYPDVFIATCSTNPANSIKHLLHNNGDSTFTDVNYAAGVADSASSWGIVWLDINNDRNLDIFIANIYHNIPQRPGYNKLYRNNGDGTFADVGIAAGAAGSFDDNSWGIAAADFDNDGWLDLYVTNSNRRHRLYRNNSDGTFTDIAESAGIVEQAAGAVAVADFNGDGWQDIVTGAFGPTRLMLNDGGTNHWLKVQARGVSANYFGVGARVEVYSDGMRQVREIRAGDSFCSQNDLLTAHFGLGSQTLADSVIVRWPGGGRDKITAVAADQIITVVQNTGINRPPSAVRLLEPPHSQVIDESASEVLFRWQEAQNPETEPLHYNLHLTGWHFDTTFTNIQDTFIVIEKNLLVANRGYLWRVDASDGFSRTASHDVFTIFPASGSILGTVVNESGDPVPDMTLYLTMHNHFLKETTTLTAVTDQNGEYRFENLPASDSTWIAYDSLHSEQVFPYPALLVENLSLSPGQPLVVNFTLRPADLLLVNGDPDAGFREEFTTAVREYGATFFEWIIRDDGEAVPVSSLDRLSNPVIVWFSGTSESAVIGNAAQDSLMMFLDQGGKLLLTGRNIVEFLHGQGSVLLQDYLHVSFGGNLNGSTLLSPIAGNPVTGGLSPFQAIQPSRDALLPDSSGMAQPALTYHTGDVAGVSLENSGSGHRAVVFGFGMEGINLSSARNALMGAMLDWFDVVTATRLVSAALPENFELLQNYPNPFNPGTNFGFRIADLGLVSLKVYDILGREIITLVNEKLAPGEYEVQWDGRDATGRKVSSGIYIYRLTAKSSRQLLFRDSRRMLLLK